MKFKRTAMTFLLGSVLLGFIVAILGFLGRAENWLETGIWASVLMIVVGALNLLGKKLRAWIYSRK